NGGAKKNTRSKFDRRQAADWLPRTAPQVLEGRGHRPHNGGSLIGFRCLLRGEGVRDNEDLCKERWQHSLSLCSRISGVEGRRLFDARESELFGGGGDIICVELTGMEWDHQPFPYRSADQAQRAVVSTFGGCVLAIKPSEARSCHKDR
ncbi:hypothetical protein chiPu_0023453, partial [Chiloscyllium punctatum]|nr:hypothetical protein [Chiloscyllium punctatum]